MNGLTLLVVLALAIAGVVAWRVGVMQGRREQVPSGTRDGLRPAVVAAPAPAMAAAAPAAAEALPVATPAPPAPTSLNDPDFEEERARLVRSLVDENARLRIALADAAATESHLAALAEDRRRLFATLAAARGETARYRAIVIDLEDNALPPLLTGTSAPDDLKLIVGIGPVLERMLQQMGITTYRQIARWSERDIDDYDAKLAEFPGRIRRDGWVTQARSLHQSKYGVSLPTRDRG